jgi:hypothetical protein
MVAVGVGSCLPDLGPLPAQAEAGSACGDGILELGQDGGGGEECDPGNAPNPGCLDCRVVCEGAKDPATGHCYFPVGADGPDFRSTVAACAQASAHVVTIGTDGERAIVDGVADGGSYWVGLEYTDQEPAYTVSSATLPPLEPAVGIETGWPQPPCRGPCTGCYGFGLDGGGFALRDGGLVPDDPGGNCRPPGACVASLAGPSRWAQVDCIQPGLTLATICERDPPGQIAVQTCGGLPCFSIRPSISKKLYVVHGDVQLAKDVDCGEGARLFHIDSDEERLEVVDAFFHSQIYSFDEGVNLWIGLHQSASGDWVWDDGKSRPDVHVWGDRQPPDDATGRAQIRFDRNYDSGLVYAAASGETDKFAYLCEQTQ